MIFPDTGESVDYRQFMFLLPKGSATPKGAEKEEAFTYDSGLDVAAEMVLSRVDIKELQGLC